MVRGSILFFAKFYFDQAGLLEESDASKQNSSNKTYKKQNTSNSRSDQVGESEVFFGRKFVNIMNDCYINSIVNLILSSEAIREGVIGKLCDCTLCQHLFNFLNDSNKSHNARSLKILLARLNPATFGEDNLNKLWWERSAVLC